MNPDRIAAIAKALGHPARVQIVDLLAREQECRGADVFAALPLAQSTVSQHLAVLKDAGVVDSHQVGQSSVYCVQPQVLKEFAAHISELAARVPRCSTEAKECA